MPYCFYVSLNQEVVSLRQAKISLLKQILTTVVHFDVVKEVDVFQVPVQASLENCFIFVAFFIPSFG